MKASEIKNFMNNKIWLTWESQRRNRSMSEKLHADLHEITTSGARWKRYPIQIFKTLYILYKYKPTILFSQNPSLLLAAISILYGKISSTTVIIDSHNAGIFPLEGRSKTLNKIAKFINSHSAKVIVTNVALKTYIKKNVNDVYVIPDPIPVMEKRLSYPVNNEKFNIVFICSWAEDEPYLDVLEIAENLTDSVHIFVTGNSHDREKAHGNRLPTNVSLTGFLSNEDYDDLLFACDAVMVLTKRNNCLVCGAYEGTATKKPMIISDTNSLRAHFNKGCVYTDNSSGDIERAIMELINNYSQLTDEIITLKTELENDTDLILDSFSKMLMSETK